MQANLLKLGSMSLVLASATYLLAIAPGAGYGQGELPPLNAFQNNGASQSPIPPSPIPNAGGANRAIPGSANGTGAASAQAVFVAAPAHVGSAGSAMMASALLSNGNQQMVIFDHSKQTLAVYHIVPSTGDIQLKSVRRVDADFALEEFNVTSPTPSEIRANVK